MHELELCNSCHDLMMEALSFSEVATVCINHTNHCSCLVNEKIIINKIMMKIMGKFWYKIKKWAPIKMVAIWFFMEKSMAIKKVLFNYLGF